MNQKRATLDLSGCQYISEMHQRIKEALQFPEYYGENWDAFWDCINRECDIDHLTVVGSSKVAKELQPALQTMIELLEENKEWWANSDTPFRYEIIS